MANIERFCKWVDGALNKYSRPDYIKLSVDANHGLYRYYNMDEISENVFDAEFEIVLWLYFSNYGRKFDIQYNTELFNKSIDELKYWYELNKAIYKIE